MTDSEKGADYQHPHLDHEQHQRGSVKTVQVERKVQARNEERAAENRRWLKERKVTSFNLISSPGTGKTMLLEKTLDALKGRAVCGVIVGDQQTDNDARRLAGRGAEVRQIETGNTCHLDAERVGARLADVVLADTKLLFIENVGNLICPAGFNLGEDFKVALLSVTEGEDKPVKYPVIFSRADVVVITKIDLAPHLEWNRESCLANVKTVGPRARIFEVSSKTGEGMQEWIAYLLQTAEEHAQRRPL